MTDGDAAAEGGKKLRILVTGARGTLGRPLVSELRARGHEVHQIDMLHSPAENYLRCDVRDFRQLEQAFEVKPDVVYHLAAEFGRHNGDEFYEQCWTTNCVGTRNVIELCVRNETRLVFSSSSEIYGELPAAALAGPHRRGLRPAAAAAGQRLRDLQVGERAADHQRRGG